MNYIFKKYINIRKQNKIIQFIFVYCAFAVFAEIGRFLIVPPGQASIIWPAAGFSIAAVYILGYRVALAIFLGAITNSLRHYSDINIHEILTAVGIGIGTAAQAVVATFFIKKIYKEKTLLGNLKDTIAFMIIAGPLACVMSAVIASITLLQAGIIPQGELVDHIFSWWIGDVFGVVVFGPICMIALSKKTDENGLTLKRRLLVGIPMIISLFIFVSLLSIFIDSAYQKSFQEYSKKSQSAIKDFKKDLAMPLNL
jgi:integral membrane sensor domain MASE1